MKFTIIVPVYNVEKYIEKCIESILKQSFKNFELILVDDGSLDKSSVLCDRFAAQDDRVIVIHKKNGGVVSARLEGLNIATGEYVVFADADDWVESSLLSELAHVIDENNIPDMVIYDAQKVYINRTEKMIQAFEPGYYDKERIMREIVPYMLYDKRQSFLTAMISGQMWSKAFKLELIRNHICADENIRRLEDFACVYECIYYSNSLYYLNKDLYFYNKTNSASIMSVYDPKYFQNHCKVIEYISEHLGRKSEILQKQITANNVSGICIGVFHPIRSGKGLREAARQIKIELESTRCLSNADCSGLPIHAHLYIFLLKHKMYYAAVLIAKLYLQIKK